MDETLGAVRGQVGGAAARVYEEFFVPALFAQWAPRVLELAGLGVGDDVLDVGCGTGVLARAAAGRLAGSGSVTGVDVNEGMLAVARTESDAVSWRQADAVGLPFADDSFDRVLSQFLLMFLEDPSRALAEMARVGRPGGRVVALTWARVEESPGYAAMVTLLDRVLGQQAAEALRAPFTLGTREQLLGLASPVFRAAEVVRWAGQARFPSLEAWIHTDIRGWTLAEAIDDQQHAAVLDRARTDLAEFVGADGSVAFAATALALHASL